MGKKVKKKKVKLTLRNKLFLKKYFETGNATKSYAEVYKVDYKSAAELASRRLRKVENIVRGMMEVKGLSLGVLIEEVLKGVKQKKVNKTKLEYIQTAAKWLGLEQQAPAVAIQFNTLIQNKRGEYGF